MLQWPAHADSGQGSGLEAGASDVRRRRRRPRDVACARQSLLAICVWLVPADVAAGSFASQADSAGAASRRRRRPRRRRSKPRSAMLFSSTPPRSNRSTPTRSRKSTRRSTAKASNARFREMRELEGHDRQHQSTVDRRDDGARELPGDADLRPQGRTKQNSAVTRVIRLRRQETVWLIDGFER